MKNVIFGLGGFVVGGAIGFVGFKLIFEPKLQTRIHQEIENLGRREGDK